MRFYHTNTGLKTENHINPAMTKARKTALYNVLDTFYKGAEASAVMSILKESEGKLSEEEAASIIELIEKSRKEGR